MILIIDNYDSFTYNLYQMLAQMHPNTYVIRNDALSVQGIDALAPQAIVISPGPGRPENAGICLPLIKRLAPHTPILGICLGHQAMGAAFGGKVVSAGKIVHGKISQIYHDSTGLFQGLPVPFEAGRYHSLMVERESLPPELHVLAETEDGIIMAMKHKDYPCYGIQFHPESVLTSCGDKILHSFLYNEVRIC